MRVVPAMSSGRVIAVATQSNSAEPVFEKDQVSCRMAETKKDA
jgi:hypothetical protein